MKSDYPLVSVIIPCYNAREWIEETIDSVLKQSYPREKFEIIVINDGSTDGSREILEEMEISSLSLINIENGGVSRARNLGIEKASGDYFKFLDADDLLSEDNLRFQVEKLEETGADIAYSDWQRLYSGEEGKEFSEVISRKEHKIDEITLFVNETWGPVHSYLYRRKIVEKVGGFHLSLPVIQDARFTLDCALKGARFVYVPGPVARYRFHSDSQLSRKNEDRFVEDCFQNAREIHQLWATEGPLTERRKKALLQVYYYTARHFFVRNQEKFDECLKIIRSLEPKFIPETPRRMHLASRIVGYENAERIAYWYRKLKNLIF